jgi:hypothetical protein
MSRMTVIYATMTSSRDMGDMALNGAMAAISVFRVKVNHL